MGRRANYGWEKRQRELKKQKKKDAKAEKKRLAREAASGDGAMDGDGQPIEAADGAQLGNGDADDGDLPEARPDGDPAVRKGRGGPA